MLFNTPQYILFLPLVVLVYYCLPKKVRYIRLLLTTYLCGRMMETCKPQEADGEEVHGSNTEKEDIKKKKQKLSKKKIYFIICILLNLGILGFFKYFQFGIGILNRLLVLVHIHEISWKPDILLPVGISFYTLQALGYLIDVYRGEISYGMRCLCPFSLNW